MRTSESTQEIRLTEPLDVAVGLREANVVVGVRVRAEVGLITRVGQVEIMSAAPVERKEEKGISEKRSNGDQHNYTDHVGQ